jgi:murein biosynthesis integral membrane protein MurJ
MSQLNTDTGPSEAVGTASARLVAIRVKSANKNIFRALLSLSSANLLIRLMGLFNIIIVTARFGQGPAMDAYFVASTLPTLLAQLLASSLEASVIPIYAGLRAKGGREKASRFFSTLLNLLIIGAILLTAVMFIFREPLLHISAPGTDQGVLTQTVALAPLVFPVLVFVILNSYMEFLLNAEGTFGWPAYAGLLVPLITATFVLLIGNKSGVFAIGLGTLVGQCVQLCVIIFRARQANLKYHFILDFRMPEIQAVARRALPSLSGGIIALASPLVDQIFASYQAEGTIAAINNALKISSVATGVIFAAAGRAALPYLSAQIAMKDMKAFKGTLRLYLWGVAIVTFFVSVFMIVFSPLIVTILFRHGAFSDEDVNRTAITLAGFAIGLVPMAIGFILSRAFLALGRNRLMMIVTLLSVILNAVFDAIFGRLWQSFGIAFATSLYYVCSMCFLIFVLSRSIGKLDFLKPPPELVNAVWKAGLEPYYDKWLAWQEKNIEAQGISLHEFYQVISRWLLVVIVFAAGIYGSIANALLTVRAAFGLIVIFCLLRYQYALLLAWASLNAFIGSPLPFFNGNNLLSGLTLPTFLLLFYLPTRVALKRMRALPFLFTFLLWILLTVWFSPISSASDFLTSWSIMFDFFGVCVLVILIIDSHKRLLSFIDVIHIPAVFIALYGIWGYATRTVGILDVSTGSFRVTSIFTQTPPGLALYLSIIMPLTIYRIWTLQGPKRLGSIAVLVLFATTIALTFSRGPLIIIPLSSIIIIPLIPAKRARTIILLSYLVIALLSIVAAITLHLSIFDRFLNSDLTSLNGRTDLWAALLSHFDPTRLQGYGFQASDLLLAKLQVSSGTTGVVGTVAHNLYLEMMYNYGLIGLTFLLLTFIVQGISLLHQWFITKSVHHRFLLALVLWALISATLQCFEVNDLWDISQISVYFFMVLALPFAICWMKEDPNPEHSESVDKAAIKEGTASSKAGQVYLSHV